ncbi:Bug family tripartite tricarboxylate transporter substrate binding protein [Paracraurococcus ruber]|nr:tripartite tricarboxylate transporter substrate binding protein [Paracraurococcus ruber]TDG30907.1 tripartite tricarboxylate transporter substrate binding protein [Paracraurococcus ruber]
MRRLARRALLAAPMLLPGLRAAAQGFPARSLTWIVPFAAGGITDTSARTLAQRMGQVLGQSVVVENRPGAGGTIGAEAVARSAPDGYTFLYGSQGPMASAPAMFPGLRYDPQRDLAPVHGLGASPHLIVCAPSRPWHSLADLVAAARARPDGLTYASVGVGTSPHLAAETLLQATGARMVHAPYANGTQGLNDVIAGRVDAMWDYPLTSLGHVREGRLRALAVTDGQRVRLAPEVPTVAEAGFAAAESVPWAGLFVAARTPDAVIARLSAALREAMGDPKVQEFFDGTATVLWPEMGPQELRAFLAAEIPRIARLIERSGARPG